MPRNEYGIRNITRNNLLHYINNKLLSAGFYTPIGSGEKDFLSNTLSQLDPILNDPTYGDNRVYKAPFSNWVSESGISPPSGFSAPIIPSSIFINNVETFRTDSTNGYFIDYYNGEIIFNTAKTNITVNVVYTFKNYWLDFISNDWILKVESLYTDNPKFDLQQQKHLNARFRMQQRPLPLILIDFFKRERTGLQLGGGKIVTEKVFLHIFDDADRGDDLADLFMNLEASGFRMLDFRKDIRVPMDFNGDYPSGHKPYTTAIADSSLWYKVAQILTAESSDIHIGDIYQGLTYNKVQLTLEVRIPEI